MEATLCPGVWTSRAKVSSPSLSTYSAIMEAGLVSKSPVRLTILSNVMNHTTIDDDLIGIVRH